MKVYIIITLLSLIACSLILIQDRSIVIVSNIKHLEGDITISSFDTKKVEQSEAEWSKAVALKDFLEIYISVNNN